MTVRSWILIIANSLLAVVILTLSLLFYYQFEKTLDLKMLSQLSSIERLKRVQIENYIRSEWEKFEKSEIPANYDIKNTSGLPYTINAVGVYDLTPISKDGKLLIGLVKKKAGQEFKIRVLNSSFIQKILLERTGMGASGETYLVGEDCNLRTQSRFFPEKAPFTIQAKTKHVVNAFANEFSNGIQNDYRGIPVFSAYQLIEISHLKLVILSEIDVEEAFLPLKSTKETLIAIAVSILLIAFVFGSLLAKHIAKPLHKMEREILKMSEGNYKTQIVHRTAFKEIDDMLQALAQLNSSLASAVNFSQDLGTMNLNTSYEPINTKDILGHSLVKMQSKLKEYQSEINQVNTNRKRSLIEGQELERKRLSQELHDGLGPLLTSLRFYIESLEIDKTKKKEAKEIIDKTIQEIRRMVLDLMPPTLIDFGVGAALKSFIDLIEKTTKINIKFINSIAEDSAIPVTTSIALFRVSQELINNSIKHSKADKIRISITEFDTYINYYYFDNGIGYNPNEIINGAGLINIKERIELLNGTIQFSPRNKNATVEIEIPFENA